MTNSTLSVALVGIGGYGQTYLSSLFDDNGSRARMIAAVDPNPAACILLPELQRRKIPIYSSIQELQARHSPDLVVISTPLQLHSEQVVAALSGASHVLCEKPLCSTPAQAAKMLAARERAQRQVSIGYQWSFNPCIGSLKRHISSGIFGQPKRLRTLVLWPRSEAYYHFNSWKGRRYTKSGVPIFDSPLNNACAHHLHNMLYLLGNAPDRSASAATVTAELYRANSIETFDTAAVRVETTDGVELSIVVSHATLDERGPSFTFEFEDATITFEGEQPNAQTCDGPPILVHFHNGKTRQYGSPESFPDRKLWAAVESAKFNVPTVCGIETALPQTQVTAAVHRSVPQAIDFPKKLINVLPDGTSVRRWIEGLDDVLINSYVTGKLPSELSVPWAVAGKTIHLTERTVRTVDPKFKISSRVKILPQIIPTLDSLPGTV